MSQDFASLISIAFALVCGVIILVVVRSSKKKRYKRFEEDLVAQGFSIDQGIHFESQTLFFDFEKKQFCVRDGRKYRSVQIQNAADIVEFVVYDDRNKAIEGKRDAELRGLYVLGEDNAIQYDYKRLNKLRFFDLRVYIYMPQKSTPAVVIKVIEQAKRDSEIFVRQMAKLNDVLTALVKVMELKTIDMAALWDKDETAYAALEIKKKNGEISEEEFASEVIKIVEGHRP